MIRRWEHSKKCVTDRQTNGQTDRQTSLWRHRQSIMTSSAEHKASEWNKGGVWRSLFLASFIDSLCRIRNRIMYLLLWRTVYALTRVLCVYFPRWCATREINTKIILSWAHNSSPRENIQYSIWKPTTTTTTKIPHVEYLSKTKIVDNWMEHKSCTW